MAALTDTQWLFAFFFTIYFALTIERANVAYKSWDTYGAWRGNAPIINRLLAGWAFLFIIPILHFSILLALMGSFNISFDLTIKGILNLALISLGSFFDFGYYRIYEAFLHTYPEAFFTDEELAHTIHPGKIRPDFWAHFIPGTLYVIFSTMMVLLSILLSR